MLRTVRCRKCPNTILKNSPRFRERKSRDHKSMAIIEKDSLHLNLALTVKIFWHLRHFRTMRLSIVSRMPINLRVLIVTKEEQRGKLLFKNIKKKKRRSPSQVQLSFIQKGRPLKKKIERICKRLHLRDGFSNRAKTKILFRE